MRRHELPWPNALLLEETEDDAAIETWRSWFASDELEIVASFARQQRRTQWLLSRTAAKQLALERGLCSDARECRVERTRIAIGSDAAAFTSLSHSGPFGAAAIGNAPVGIDVQVVREVKEIAAHLFLTGEEERVMQSCRIEHRLLHFWCAKEAAWKALGGEPATLSRVPLSLLSEDVDGLRFDTVETRVIGELVVALTRPTS